MKTQGEILKNMIRGKGLTMEEAAAKLGMSRQNLHYHLSRGAQDKDFLQKVKQKLYILIDEEALTVAEPPSPYDVKQVEEEGFMKVPVLSVYAQASYLKGQSDAAAEKKLDKMLIPKEYDNGHYLVVEVQGDSMDDNTSRALKAGDKLLIKELDKEFWRNKLHIHNHVWVIVHREGIYFKQIVKHDIEKAMITCHSWNAFYKDYDVKLKDVIRLFYVKKLVERVIKP